MVGAGFGPLRLLTEALGIELEKLTGAVECSKKDHFKGSGNKAGDHQYGF